jgi:arylsulfatase A-like enzyme
VSATPNVLLVVLDSTRAQNTSLHGYDRGTTPFLESFADRSTLYTQARAPSIHSIASHVSMFTGAHVEEHQAIRHTAQIDTARTIWHELATDFGYETGLFTNNRIVSNASNLGDAFGYAHEPDYPIAERLENAINDTPLQRVYFHLYDSYERLSERLQSVRRNRPRLNGALSSLAGAGATIQSRFASSDDDDSAESGYKSMHGGEFTNAFLDWQAEQSGNWAACINLMDTHSPYQPEEEYDLWATEDNWECQREHKPSVWDTLDGEGWEDIEALEALYDGTIRQADMILEDLVTRLDERGELDDTLLIITSDHGEAFGERSRLNPDIRLRGHKWGIPEVLTHVPLLIKYPGQTDGRVVDDVVSLTDLPRLIRTTLSEGGGTLATDDPVLASTFRIPEAKISKYRSIDDLSEYIGPWRAVYESTDGTVRKYAQKADHYLTGKISAAGEVTVESREPHDRVATAYGSLSDDEIVTAETTEIDEELEERLEDLGYMR